jgi:hypothetical protein
MSRNNLILAALGGAAAAALITNYLGTEKGKQMLESASGTLKDLTTRATEFAKNNLGSTSSRQDNVQPS